MYNCTAQRPGANGSTKEDTVEPQTESVTVTATSIYVATIDKDIVKAETAQSTDSTTYSTFFSSVYTPAAVASTATT
jgi:hypothetical protein